jgi:uncharacterized protein YggE
MEFFNNIAEATLKKLMMFFGVIILAMVIIFGIIIGIKKVDQSTDGIEPTITINGTGEIMATPDIAKLSFTVTEESSTMAAAQKTATEKINTILDQVKKAGVEDKDIKTVNYQANPKYEWKTDKSSCVNGYCPEGRQEITGYTVTHNIDIKVRNTDNIGDITTILTTAKVADLQGPNFQVDDMDVVKAEARSKAITDAREKAKVMAKDLGVKLGKVVSFYDNTDMPYPVPMVEMSSDMMMAKSAMGSAPSPSIPVGENKIISSVSVTFRIK